MIVVDESELAHFGVKGMRWGVRKEEKPPNSDTTRKIKKGAVIAGSILAVAGAIAVTSAVHNSHQQQAAQRLLQQKLDVPFQWRDRAGDWHRYAKTGGLWETGR